MTSSPQSIPHGATMWQPEAYVLSVMHTTCGTCGRVHNAPGAVRVRLRHVTTGATRTMSLTEFAGDARLDSLPHYPHALMHVPQAVHYCQDCWRLLERDRAAGPPRISNVSTHTLMQMRRDRIPGAGDLHRFAPTHTEE